MHPPTPFAIPEVLAPRNQGAGIGWMMLLLHLGLPDFGSLASLGPWLGLAALGAFHGLPE
jgi:hypothetical protein